MSAASPPETYLTSGLWHEEPEPDDPFAARAALCHGYDVYGDMLGRCRWVDMLHLLFKGEAPTAAQAAALELLAVALANPGLRDPSVHAAMCGAVGGSPAAACLMSALAVGAGASGGGRELAACLAAWLDGARDLSWWQARWRDQDTRADVFPPIEHPIGCDPHGTRTATPVRQLLAALAEQLGPDARVTWLREHLGALEGAAGRALSMVGVAAAALADLGFSAREGEMLFLLLRLPGAAAHALEQGGLGPRRFPFYRIELVDGPR